MEVKQMKIKDIKISDSFKKTRVNWFKMKEKWFYYRQTSKLESDIVVDQNNVLIDGYTSYLIAEADGIKKVEVIVETNV